MKKLVIFGSAGFAEIAHFYFTHDSPYTVAAFTVDREYLKETTYHGLPVVPFEEVLTLYPPEDHDLFVAIGIGGVNRHRAAKAAEGERLGYRLASFLSSRADVSPDLQLSPNTMIMERAGIQPYVEIGRNTIIWSATRIGFRTRIGADCWIVSAIFGESVEVGSGAFVGLNATIAPGISIGANCIIGAGALILRDTGEGQVWPGHGSSPSRVGSSRLWHD